MFTNMTTLKKRHVFALLMMMGNLTACNLLFPASATKGVAPLTATQTGTPAPDSEASPAPETKPEVTKLSDEQILKDNFNTSRSQRQMDLQKVSVERHFQRVVRRDCSGVVTSDKEETVLSPHFDLKLKAPNWHKFKSVFVYNEKTGDTNLTEMPNRNWPIVGLLSKVTGSGRWGIKIKGDVAPAALTFHIESGLNNIFVEYHYDCIPKNVPGSKKYSDSKNACVESKEKILVHYPVEVVYQEKHLNGTFEINKLPSECEAK